jgi:hypothetical protein
MSVSFLSVIVLQSQSNAKRKREVRFAPHRTGPDSCPAYPGAASTHRQPRPNRALDRASGARPDDKGQVGRAPISLWCPLRAIDKEIARLHGLPWHLHTQRHVCRWEFSSLAL